VEEVKSEQIEDILAKFSEMGINVVETKEAAAVGRSQFLILKATFMLSFRYLRRELIVDPLLRFDRGTTATW
jgi:hypothetical protein